MTDWMDAHLEMQYEDLTAADEFDFDREDEPEDDDDDE